MKSFLNNKDKVTVFAASNGESVEAITDTMERMTRIESRFHNGQFFHGSAQSACQSYTERNAYQRIIRVI